MNYTNPFYSMLARFLIHFFYLNHFSTECPKTALNFREIHLGNDNKKFQNWSSEDTFSKVQNP